MPVLSVNFGGYTRAGIKPQNQDAFAVQTPTGSVLESKGVVASIADGLSSCTNAQLAARTCANSFVADFLATPETWGLERSAARIVRSLNDWCFAQGQSEINLVRSEHKSTSMLTTLSSLVLRGIHGHIFHVGDSRIYRWQNDSLEQLTRDHKQSSGGQQFLTRTIGGDTHIDVDHIKVELAKGDLFVLTTDGVHDFISNKELARLLNMTHVSFEQKAQAIVELALNNGSDDNVSCLLVSIVTLPEMNLNESYNQLARLAIPPAMEVGNKIEGYQVIEVLFSGTRSYLYKVRDIESGIIYALKAPSSALSEDLAYLKGFAREQWIGQRINHQNVMKILPRKVQSQFMYHVCEYIEGQTIRQWMIDNPVPSLEQVRQLLKPVISALRQIQRLDMVHRDLKPENIMISHIGEVKLIDFGTIYVAALAEEYSTIEGGIPQGSVNYVAPESLILQQCDHCSDIFSLGVITYEMLTNQLPFKPFLYKDYQPKTWSEWQYKPLHQTKANLPPWVDVTLRKVLQPNPAKRYQALSEFLVDLQQPSEAHLNTIRNAPFIERNPLLFWKLLAGVLLIGNVVQIIF